MLRALLRWADAVMVEFPWQFGYCWRERRDARLVYASHNVESEKFASYAEVKRPGLTRLPWLMAIRRMEENAVRRADLVLAVSGEDRNRFIDLYDVAPAKVVEVPNGADTARYAPTDPDTRAAAKKALGLPNRPTVFFAGANVPPNQAGRDWVYRLAEHEPGFTFLVVGLVAEPRVEGSLVCVGRVADIRAYLAAADLAVVPIAHGGGTKIKLFESVSAGLPTVAFDEAIRGTVFRDGEHLLIAEKNVVSLAHALRRLVDEPSLGTQLSRSGRELVVARYDWRSSGAKLERALLDLHGINGGAEREHEDSSTGRHF